MPNLQNSSKRVFEPGLSIESGILSLRYCAKLFIYMYPVWKHSVTTSWQCSCLKTITNYVHSGQVDMLKLGTCLQN